jgi:lipid II:glycine glycyltransferase (peptidoglycan interpeptide bridge formation enzyme)
MIYGGETSYHHGASSYKFPKVPASYLLQWRAIQDALKRGDRVYNFWGVAPGRMDNGKWIMDNAGRHPFSGVTTFKTGFGGQLLELQHCMDLPLSKKYWLTWGIETVRKWRRGF